jgi:TPR repeat protein
VSPREDRGKDSRQIGINGDPSVAQDYAEALRWYCKAADQGYAAAQYSLRRLYQYGQRVL